jgi:hypothetical protein
MLSPAFLVHFSYGPAVAVPQNVVKPNHWGYVLAADVLGSGLFCPDQDADPGLE